MIFNKKLVVWNQQSLFRPKCFFTKINFPFNCKYGVLNNLWFLTKKIRYLESRFFCKYGFLIAHPPRSDGFDSSGFLTKINFRLLQIRGFEKFMIFNEKRILWNQGIYLQIWDFESATRPPGHPYPDSDVWFGLKCVLIKINFLFRKYGILKSLWFLTKKTRYLETRVFLANTGFWIAHPPRPGVFLLPSFEIVTIFALRAEKCKYKVFNEMWETVQIWGFENFH